MKDGLKDVKQLPYKRSDHLCLIQAEWSLEEIAKKQMALQNFA